MSETLTNHEHEIAKIREELKRIEEELAAYILLFNLGEDSLHIAQQAHQEELDQSTEPENTDQTNRQRWEEIHKLFENRNHTSAHQHFNSALYQRTIDDLNQRTSWWHSEPNFNGDTSSNSSNTHNYNYSKPKEPKYEYTTQTASEPEPKPQPAPMPFNFYPSSMQPTDTETQAAARANSLMRTNLEAEGWEGGAPTEKQFNRAARTTVASLHPDQGETSDVDQDAIRLINGQKSEIKKDLYGDPTSSSGEHAQAA